MDFSTSLTVGQDGEGRLDTRILASALETRHENTMNLVDKYAHRLEEWGQVRVSRGVGNRSGTPVRYAMLNEGQFCYILTLVSVTDKSFNAVKQIIDGFIAYRHGPTPLDVVEEYGIILSTHGEELKSVGQPEKVLFLNFDQFGLFMMFVRGNGQM
jgi:hypothetical protein